MIAFFMGQISSKRLGEMVWNESDVDDKGLYVRESYKILVSVAQCHLSPLSKLRMRWG